MLKKLLKYDFLSVKRFVLPLMLLTPAASFVFGMIGYIANLIDSPVVQMGLMTMYVISLIALFLSVTLLPVLLIVRYYSGMFGDAGYVSLLLPVSRKLLLLSKVLYALILMLWYLLFAFFSIGFAFCVPDTAHSGHTIFYAYVLAFDLVKGLFTTFGGFSAGGLVAFVFYLIFMMTFLLNLFYTGVTLGAAIFQGKAKVAGAIAFCVASYMIWSVIKTAIEAIPTAIIVSRGVEAMMNATVLRIFLIAEMALYAGFSVLLFFLNSRLIDRKLNLT